MKRDKNETWAFGVSGGKGKLPAKASIGKEQKEACLKEAKEGEVCERKTKAEKNQRSNSKVYKH
ncbi:hypothetical protein NECAME_12281 [Necator americanus]|uniref:Uncharacterized protein n=1 Tax=Necator americanus TaxID=51031 RepID=W2T0P5_NECAM|nr:hypothetical protein NECAME_12281 [Necator americanus]ETN75580.1 hypothetical protein NECAME_12281 [Necator americanus]